MVEAIRGLQSKMNPTTLRPTYSWYVDLALPQMLTFWKIEQAAQLTLHVRLPVLIPDLEVV